MGIIIINYHLNTKLFAYLLICEKKNNNLKLNLLNFNVVERNDVQVVTILLRFRFII